ncbi:MAG: HTH domain-containing protein [bacterium]|nr:HTH domain-containing protein [bacterium]
MKEGIVQGYIIPISNGILDPKHVNQIGQSLWVFMWMIDKTIGEYDDNGLRYGKVLNGKAFTTGALASELGIDERTVRRYIARLKKYEYITVKKTRYGMVAEVTKSKKWRTDKNGRTDISSQDKNGRTDCPDRTNLTARPDKNGRTYTDSTSTSTSTDSTVQKNTVKKVDGLGEVVDHYCETVKRVTVSGTDRQLIIDLLNDGVTTELMKRIITERTAAYKGDGIKSFKYFKDAIVEAAGEAKSKEQREKEYYDRINRQNEEEDAKYGQLLREMEAGKS